MVSLMSLFRAFRLFLTKTFFVFRIRQYDGRKAAVWSLGILLYTMIEGHVPFQRPKDIVRALLSKIVVLYYNEFLIISR